MEHIEVTFKIDSYREGDDEILIAILDNMGFDGFWQMEGVLAAYIDKNLLTHALRINLKKGIHGIKFSDIQFKNMPKINWNQRWESNYPWVLISGKLLIHAPFHTNCPHAEVKLVIEPKMSFGTGHHATTMLMSEFLLEEIVTGKRVLDMGCGTGVLGILASKLGAKSVTGIDNDENAVENSIENTELNKAQMIVMHGEVNAVVGQKFDLIIANINRNVLLCDIPIYRELSSTGAKLFLSGILFSDFPDIKKKLEESGYKLTEARTRKEWMAIKAQTI